ncbi:MAG: hypothetical protein ETSY1_37030 [Candidatus Entotheonella factor]|uniref:Uncharacterized protein n=1 Tax=Entotheonella factor TaxID=1429438 RepID=W4L790_ENTF1|nr:MAG: hypothetical protein ETSY1_37030 [Candidatus Entotheonella factor]
MAFFLDQIALFLSFNHGISYGITTAPNRSMTLAPCIVAESA